MAERIRYNTIVEQVMGKLKSLIASGEYQPGDKLPSENELAARFGIGRSSVREAIKVFQYIGVLASYTAKGTFVCERANISTEALTWSIILGYNDLYELLELRELLEKRGIAALVEKCRSHPQEGAELLGRLEENVARMAASSNLEKIIEADYSFHNSVIEGCGNSVFLAIYQTLKSFMHDLIKEVHVEQGTARNPRRGKSHRAILEAIKAGDLDRALREYELHIANTREKLNRAMQKKSRMTRQRKTAAKPVKR